ncbi:DUF1501 domain-containing protein [Pelomonas sp. CA6]|uniref:DUF1501 domain-containing protein n=1 Tax=Pelomonas sp. CA6 TaxID=2907999 RepID=UPI001F4A6D7B|nr:DUF1501 domain-containing protein [Pelomonas sp. CA6]MCH7342030.1 DUF1501 domain-containing protein [Pelomonas sp. CA6]
MRRRHLLQSLASAPLALGAARLWAADAASASATPRFLLVFLRGAYDAANLLVPHASPFYYEARPNIAVPAPGAAGLAATALDASWALAPAVAQSLGPLWDKGQLAFVPFAGCADTSRSHFETQDRIELGQADEGARDFRSGFMNRLALVLGANAGASRLEAMAFTDQVPLVLRGSLPVANQALRELGKPGISAAQAKAIERMYAGTRLATTVSGGFEVRDEVAREMVGEMEAASRNAIGSKGFALEARRIARLMRERVTLGFIDVGGWDTHVAQGGASGTLAGKFTELGQGLATFAEEMGPQWANTTVVVLSEFGRTFRENGNRGTDHGHGSAYWVLGGGVRGGRIVGEQVALSPATLFQGRDWPVLNDYRAVLGGLFARQWGLSPAQLDAVFPGAGPRDLGLL